MTEIIAQIVAVAAQAVVQAVLKERRDEDEITRCRGDTTGMTPRLDRHSPLYTFTGKVKTFIIVIRYPEQRRFLWLNIHKTSKLSVSQSTKKTMRQSNPSDFVK